MPVTVVPEDLDETIRQSTPQIDFELEPITDEMRDVMSRIIDPGVQSWELTFHERKIGIEYGWLP